MFDVLEQRESEALQPLLEGYLDVLVRPPTHLAKYIKCVPGVKVLTPAMLRGVLKSTKAMEHIERSKQRDKTFLDILLSFITPTTTSEVVELDRCPVLPLANGRLGTLYLESTRSNQSGSDKMYFSANAECHALFSFASSILSANRGNGRFVKKILDSGLLNLKSLEKKDVSVMLDCKESWAPESTSKTWLSNFWKYINSTSPSTTEAPKPEMFDLDSLQHFPLLLIHHPDGKERLDSLHRFQNNPVVMHSAVEEHMNLQRNLRLRRCGLDDHTWTIS